MDPDHPTPPSQTATRQTQSYLRNLLEQHGLHPKNKLGQNFLIDLNVLDLLVRSAELSSRDVVIEVGSGTGSLTQRLADAAGAVVTVEIDPAFHSLVQEIVGDSVNVQLLHADILKSKNQLHPDVLATLRGLLEARPGSNLKLVANLPYAVATPVIANFLISDLTFERMVVTVQWEIAERLLARPGTKDYGALAVLVQSLADVALVRKLAPSVFWPRPLVHSAIVRIDPVPAKRQHVGNVEQFRGFLRDLYTHRRKNLRAALHALPGADHSKTEVDEKLARLNLDGSVRAEKLGIDEHLRLCRTFTK
jgi:16S rRNA (adenine1518-N6/adenine1519-N6)-dimethyltransferase